MNLQNLRSEINKIDSEILALLKQRLEITNKVGKYKMQNNLPVFDEKREEEILKNLESKFSEDKTGIVALWRELMYISKRGQQDFLRQKDIVKIGVKAGILKEEKIFELVSAKKIEIVYLNETKEILENLNNGSLDFSILEIFDESGFLKQNFAELGKYNFKFNTDFQIENKIFVLLSL